MQARRHARLRREYLYRKNLEGKQRALFERKQMIKKALEEGKAIPTELRDQEAKLREALKWDDDSHAEPRSHVDDEYARAGIADPKVMITTSRDPSSRLAQFVKELRLVFPNSQRMNRGSYVIKDIVDTCRANEVTDLIVVHEHRGEPDGMVICHLPYGPTASFALSNCVLRHDIAEKKPITQAYPHLIFSNFSTPLGLRCQNVLKYLFPVPMKATSKRTVTFHNNNDFISFRHHQYEKTGHKEVELDELGPRFDMKLYQLKLGTLDQKEAESEFILRPYMNTARLRQLL